MVVGMLAAQYAIQNKKKMGGIIAILIALLALLVGGIVVGLGVSKDNRNMLIGGGVTLGIGLLALVVGSLVVRSARQAAQSTALRSQNMPLMSQFGQQQKNEEPQAGTSFASESLQSESPYQPLPTGAFQDEPQPSAVEQFDIAQLVRQAAQSPETQQAIRARLPPQAQRKFDAAMLFANQNPELLQKAMTASMPTSADISREQIGKLVQQAAQSPEAQQAIRARLTPAAQRKFDAAMLFANENPELVRQAMGAAGSFGEALKRRRAA